MRPKRRFRRREKLVELRRPDDCVGQHRMRPAPMINLMLKQMHQQSIASFSLYYRFALMPNVAIKKIRGERIANSDQPPIDLSFRALKPSTVGIADR